MRSLQALLSFLFFSAAYINAEDSEATCVVLSDAEIEELSAHGADTVCVEELDDSVEDTSSGTVAEAAAASATSPAGPGGIVLQARSGGRPVNQHAQHFVQKFSSFANKMDNVVELQELKSIVMNKAKSCFSDQGTDFCGPKKEKFGWLRATQDCWNCIGKSGINGLDMQDTKMRYLILNHFKAHDCVWNICETIAESTTPKSIGGERQTSKYTGLFGPFDKFRSKQSAKLNVQKVFGMNRKQTLGRLKHQGRGYQ